MRLLWIFALGLVVSCASKLVIPEPVPFFPPLEYMAWWHEMEACTGRTGEFWDVKWFVVDAPYLERQNDSTVTTGTHETTVYKGHLYHLIKLSLPAAATESRVKHEMIHALGISEHRYDVFVTACKVETDATIRIQSNPVGIPGS